MLRAAVTALAFFGVLLIGNNVSSSQDLDINETKNYTCANDTVMTAEACLKKTLLKDYDRTLRPVLHHSNRTTVYMSLFPIRAFVSPYSVVLICWIEQKWVDELLKWDPEEFKNLQELTLGSKVFWNPDIEPLPYQGDASNSGSSYSVTVYPNGSVHAVSSVNYYLLFKGNYSRWPHESIECVLTLQSEAHKSAALDIIMMDHKDPVMKYLIPHKDWTLESMSSARITTQTLETNFEVVNLEFKFILKRNGAMLSTVIVFPAFVFLVTQLTFFYLDKESSVRLILCSVAVTGQCIFMKYGLKAIPDDASSIPHIVFFYKYSLLISSCVLIWSITVRSICSLVKFPYWLYKIILKAHNNQFLAWFLPLETYLVNSTQRGDNDLTVPVAQIESENQQWRNMAHFLDRVFFIISLLLYLFLYNTYMP